MIVFRCFSCFKMDIGGKFFMFLVWKVIFLVRLFMCFRLLVIFMDEMVMCRFVVIG